MSAPAPIDRPDAGPDTGSTEAGYRRSEAELDDCDRILAEIRRYLRRDQRRLRLFRARLKRWMGER